MARRGAYRSEKRQKEIKRLKKQEAKRQKRLQKKDGFTEPAENDGAPKPEEGAEPTTSSPTEGSPEEVAP